MDKIQLAMQIVLLILLSLRTHYGQDTTSYANSLTDSAFTKDTMDKIQLAMQIVLLILLSLRTHYVQDTTSYANSLTDSAFTKDTLWTRYN